MVVRLLHVSSVREGLNENFGKNPIFSGKHD